MNAVLRNNKGHVIVLPEGVDKAFGVREALRLLNVDGHIAVIGDSKIDLELFAIAGFKAAAANRRALPKGKGRLRRRSR